MTDPTYDYVIVGSGAGGGPLAANLAKAGYSVCIMEAGKWPKQDHPNYDVSPDGREFLMIERDESRKSALEIVLNWSTLLEAEPES